jgi:ABC-type amino acid transport substrate-binding protein
MPPPEIIQKLPSKEIDLSLDMPLSGANAGIMEFTSPYLFSHGAVATRNISLIASMQQILLQLWRSSMLHIMLVMFAAMILFSFFLAASEGNRQENGHFTGRFTERFFGALWFSAVSMNSVGYGDYKRLSPVGRFLTFIWLLFGVLIVAFFTGAVVSSISTIDQNGTISQVSDLAHYRNGVLSGFQIQAILKENGIPSTPYQTPQEGLEALNKGVINAFDGDAATIGYLITNYYPGILKRRILSDVSLNICFGTRIGLPQRLQIEQQLLDITCDKEWASTVRRWTGSLIY